MYKTLTAEDIRRFLKVPDSYKVDALLVVGTSPRSKEYPHLYEALEKIGIRYEEETIEDTFFSEIKCLIVNDKRIWFDVVYGTAYLSELLHVASMLGSKANILLGTCGALQIDMETGDTVVPSASFGDESSTRMYQRDKNVFLFPSNKDLSQYIKKYISERKTIHEGDLMTVQAMLAETKEDVDTWNSQGYVGVDMESATMFAVSNHFNIPSAALLYVADNLIKNELTTDDSFAVLKEQRVNIRKENYEIALKVLLKLR
jgi:purine-nucleoside phosphorylase